MRSRQERTMDWNCNPREGGSMRSWVVRTLTIHMRLLALTVGSLVLTAGGCSCSMDHRQTEASAEKQSESPLSPESAAIGEGKSGKEQGTTAPVDKTEKATSDTSEEASQ